MRVSLYKHELETIATLTLDLVRLRQNECSHLAVENIGPQIFLALMDGLYSRGFYKNVWYRNLPFEIDQHFSEVQS